MNEYFWDILPKSNFANYENVQNTGFLAAGGHVYQSIKPIINPIRLLCKGYIPVNLQAFTSNRLGGKLIIG